MNDYLITIKATGPFLFSPTTVIPISADTVEEAGNKVFKQWEEKSEDDNVEIKIVDIKKI